ncbi:hypothetical protein HDU87_004474 [Geranomyces variabilis]|uniref:Uncharacterized protein n=1 Tax=Geranomyces variabilis TaxID=109894 RepID=A0AAD5TJ40_9FUNG|nr:hypothetical protein HDU87_004474 [Geranomyces variabilis]
MPRPLTAAALVLALSLLLSPAATTAQVVGPAPGGGGAPATPAPGATPSARPSVSASVSISASAAQPSPSAPPAAASSSSSSAAPLPMPTCGASPGAIQILTPTADDSAVVGSTKNITWSYSDLTLTSRFPAQQIQIFFQKSDTGVGLTAAGWKQADGGQLPPQARSFGWTVPSTGDGLYAVRVVADNVDPQRPASSSATCIPDGFPSPGNSAPFLITNAPPLEVFPDTMGPNSDAGASLLSSWSFASLQAAAAVGVTVMAAVPAALFGI